MEGTLQVTIVSGHDLVAKDGNGKSDPYCKCRLGSQKFNTSVKWKTLNPEWNESFNFVVKSVEDSLLIKCRDKDLVGRDDSLGFAFVEICGLPPGEVVEREAVLQDADSGSLQLKLLYTHLESSGETNDLARDKNRWPMHAIKFLGGEEVIVSPVNVVLESNVGGAAFFATNYRCLAVYEDSEIAWEIPLQTILRVEKHGVSLTIHGKDLRVLSFAMDVTLQREEDELARVRSQVSEGVTETSSKKDKPASKRTANKHCEKRCLFVFHTLLKYTFVPTQSRMFAYLYVPEAPQSDSANASPSKDNTPVRESNASFTSASSQIDTEEQFDPVATTATAGTEASAMYETTYGTETSSSEPRPLLPAHLAIHPRTSSVSSRFDGWSVYDPVREFERLGVPSQIWRITNVNAQYTFSPTYPRVLAAPARISDADLIAVAKFRSKARIPVLSWKSPRTQAVICRSSQPLVGLTRKRCKEDEAYLRAIRQATPDNDQSLYVIDARPRKNAVANTAMGAGFEDSGHYDGASVLFMNIHNIHVMRRSIQKLQAAIYKPDTDENFDLWNSQIATSAWLSHNRTILQAANVIVDVIENDKASVLVHCSDGWDRTAQLTSLSECLLDPYYRTIEGFAVLVEKEWVSFGHKFADRCGHHGVKKADQYSPVFIQFLDCMHLIVAQFPNNFEFNTDLLLFIADAVFSCRYGTFLFNCDREREKAKLAMRTVSVWTDVLRHKDRYTNPNYRRHHGALIPSTSFKVMQIWREYFMRYNPLLQPQHHGQFAAMASIRLTRALEHTLLDTGDDPVPKMSRFEIAADTDEETLKDLDAEVKPDDDESDDDSDNESEDDIDFDEDDELIAGSDSNRKQPFKRPEETQVRPQWVRNKHTKECFGCCKKFSLIKRRHHCRHCGLLFCASCTANRVQIPQMGYTKAVRVCNDCFALVWKAQLERKAESSSPRG